MLIKNGYIVSKNRVADLRIENGRISEIGVLQKRGDEQVLNANGLHDFYGFVDAHTHLRDPGLCHKEDIQSGTRAAAAGGYTAVAAMPNTLPPCDDVQAVRYVLEKKGSVPVLPVACITQGMRGQALTDFGALKQAGARALSDDGMPVSDPLLMKQALRYAKEVGLPLLLHEEDLVLKNGGSAHAGEYARAQGIAGIPASAEEVPIARDVILAAEADCPLHICHVSTARSVAIIAWAKQQGVRVTCETAPHYFSLCDEILDRADANTKVNPPLRTRADMEAIRRGIADGVIDMIATDHAPHTPEEKAQEYHKAPFGLIGLETAFSLSLENLVLRGLINHRRLEELLSFAPRRLFGLEDSLQEGACADLTICDTRTSRIYKKQDILSKSKNSPFVGRTLRGCVCLTMVKGEIVYHGSVD